MYTQEHIDFLNQYGCLSTAFLRRKFRYDYWYARQILQQIAKDHENVFMRSQDQIGIKGKEPPMWKTPEIRRKKYDVRVKSTKEKNCDENEKKTKVKQYWAGKS